MRAAARGLKYLVERAGGELVAREISAILRAAWPQDHQPGDDDNGRAARALLSRARADAHSREEMLLVFEELDDRGRGDRELTGELHDQAREVLLRPGRVPLLPIPPFRGRPTAARISTPSARRASQSQRGRKSRAARGSRRR